MLTQSIRFKRYKCQMKLWIFVLSVESYSLKCPSQASWKLRAQVTCNSTLKYFCLYNSVIGEYVEGCNGPDWDRKGSKRIYAGDFSRGDCIKQRFHPFIFWTNGSVSDCIYAKSICGEEGQVVYRDNSSKDDRTCRCDYENNYSFIRTPRNFCYCLPSEEDCSCYIKSCPVNHTLSAGIFIPALFLKILSEKSYIEKSQSDGDKGSVKTKEIVGEKCHEPCESTSVDTEKKNDHLRVGKERVDIEVHQSFERVILKKDEVNYLRLIHLLFRVACPIVRMKFNHEIQPNQLRKTLDKNKRKIEKFYRRKETIINDYQWDLLFGHFKGETVTSEDFDIRLMIYLLRIIANINAGDLYPVQSDTSIGAMLSKIKFIRNEATQSLEGNILEDQFNQYWDDIGQAVLKLVSSLEIHFENYQQNKGLIVQLEKVSKQENLIVFNFSGPQEMSTDRCSGITSGEKTDILESITESFNARIKRNREILSCIIDAILLCGKQNLAIRGHEEKHSNSVALLYMRAKDNIVLADHLAFADPQKKYISPE
ncbi:unnamed protein product [Mytilus coruscus]|uniref:DZIP3-like HEPN domain-containing protein n=1 Tax=Mytilus coruscus TaxID=42192 RepID=A0A6J8C0R9_MYTCO|nr:unnamed protein product [Mytilus coruscus]